VSLLNFDDKFIKYFFYCIFVCFTVLTIDGFYQFITGENILGYKYGSSRISSFFGDKKILGSYLSRLWPIFFGLSIILFKKKNKFFLFFILIFILSEVLIFLSGDRTAFFFINLSALFVILFSRNLRKLRLYTLLFSILILIVISFLNPTAKERVFDQTLTEMNLLKGVKLFKGAEDKNSKNDNEIYIFTKTHHEIYIAAYKMFLDNKFFGIGVKNFRIICNDTKYYVSGKPRCFTHPHNSYLQLLTETGIIGFLFLVTSLIYFLKYLLKHLILKFKGNFYFNDFEICILSGIAIYLWPFVPTGNFFNNWLNIVLILNLPFLIWSRKSKNTLIKE
jgi:O-antigen ligase